jgi:hypothetical protein
MSVYTDTYEESIELLNELLDMPEFDERHEKLLRLRNRLRDILSECY